MQGIMKAAIAGGCGVFIAEAAQPYIDQYIPATSAFGKKLVKAGVGAGSTGAAYYLLGVFGMKSS